MWFENAIGNEKIKFMFDGDLPLTEMELTGCFFEQSTVLLSFIYKKRPTKYPAKWNIQPFNALTLSISLSDIMSFECKGGNALITTVPKIETKKEYSVLHINHPNLYLYCKAKFLTIEGVYPHDDIRWD